MVQSGVVPPGITADALPPPASRPSAPPPPADPAFASQLGPEVKLADGYAIRPPAGYTLQQSRQVYLDGSGTVFLWTGPQRPDGTMPTLQVVISEDDGRMASQSNASQMTQRFLTEEGSNHTHLTVSPVAACTVSGLPFAHGAWSGTGARTGKTFEGIVYISVASSRYIEVSSHDARPYSRSTLPLLTAASLTFRRV